MRKYTEEQLLEILRQKAKELGRAPYKTEIKQFQAYYRVFGSLNNALKTAGFNNVRILANVKENKRQLLEMYKKFSKKIGKNTAAGV